MTDLSVLPRIGLLLVRPGMVVAAAPVFGGMFVPMPVKAGLTVVLAFMLVPAVDVPASLPAAGVAAVAAREAAIGLALAMAVRLLVAAAEVGGALTGFQIGFSYASVVDPVGGARNNVVASLYGSLAILTLFAVNGHHAVIRALALSYQELPLGAGSIDGSMAETVARMLALVFAAGVQMAAPVVVVLLLVELTLGLVARAAPALNLLSVGFSVRAVIGLLALAATVHVLPSIAGRAAQPAFALAAKLAGAFR